MRLRLNFQTLGESMFGKIVSVSALLIVLFSISSPVFAQKKQTNDAQNYQAQCAALAGPPNRYESANAAREARIQRCVQNKGKM
jgi:hypothetical protein